MYECPANHIAKAIIIVPAAMTANGLSGTGILLSSTVKTVVYNRISGEVMTHVGEDDLCGETAFITMIATIAMNAITAILV